jgi:Na+/H+ antiporter NhaC
LSSVGAGSDHMDHVVTQLPYAFAVACLTVILYLWI